MIEATILAALLDAQTDTSQKITGPMLAKAANVSRNAIWKTIENLRARGYVITSAKETGYRIEAVPKHLDHGLLQYYLRDLDDLAIFTYDAIDSTNNAAKDYVNAHPIDPALFVSKKQTQGRGRYGRQFLSDLTDGLYFSLKIRPNTTNPEEIPLYTLLTAAAITEVLTPHLDESLKIKWINDLFYRQRKVCGILCEAVSNIETLAVDTIVIGCGLNLAGDFTHASEEVKQVAGTLFGTRLPETLNVNRLVADIIKRIYHYHQYLATKAFLDTYRDHLMGIGKPVCYEDNGQHISGEITGIDANGHLLFRTTSGENKRLFNERIHFSSQQFAQ